jgi:hypothetical protein
MSGAFASVPMGVKVLNPWQGMQEYNQGIASQALPAQAAANVQRTQATTALTGQQATLTGQQAIGANIQNQQGMLGLGYRQWQYGQIMGGGGASSYQGDAQDVLNSGGQMPGQAPPVTQGAAPAAQAGAPAPQVGATAGQDGGGGISTYATATEPVTSPGGPAGAVLSSGGQPPLPAIGSTVPVGTLPAISAGGVPGAAPGGGGGGGGSALPRTFTGAGGVIIPGMAFPVPKMWAPGYVQAQDQSKALEQLQTARALELRQRIMGTLNQNGQVDPDKWNVAVKQAFNDGLIDNQHLMQYYNHPGEESVALNTFLPPEQSPVIQGQRESAVKWAGVAPGTALTAGQEGARAGFDLVDVPMPGPTPNSTVMQRMTRAEAVQRFGGQLPSGSAPVGGGTGAQVLSGANAPMSGATYANLVKGHESPGGNPYAPNASGPGGTPSSSAVGDQQFVDGTWLTEMKRYRPDLTDGQTDAQILAMRGNPALSAEMTQRYAVENGPILQRAGIEPNAASLALAHAFGPHGLIKIAQADTNTPMSTVFPASVGPNGQAVPNPVIAANPSYANMTAGQMLSGYVNRLGRGPVDFSSVGGPAPTQPGQTAPAPTPGAQNRITNDNKALENDTSDMDKRLAMSSVASSAKPVLYDIQRLAPEAITGSLAGPRQAFANFMQTFGGTWSQTFLKDTSNLSSDPNVASQELVKQLTKNVTNAEAQMGQGAGSVRFGAMLTQFLARANPNTDMPATAITEMTNWLLAQTQMIQDYATGSQRHFQAARTAFQGDAVNNPYQPLSNFEGAWLDSKSPNAPVSYQAAALAMNHRPFSVWAKNLTPAQVAQVGGIVARADPTNGGLLDSKNRWLTAQQLTAANATPEPTVSQGQ